MSRLSVKGNFESRVLALSQSLTESAGSTLTFWSRSALERYWSQQAPSRELHRDCQPESSVPVTVLGRDAAPVKHAHSLLMAKLGFARLPSDIARAVIGLPLRVYLAAARPNVRLSPGDRVAAAPADPASTALLKLAASPLSILRAELRPWTVQETAETAAHRLLVAGLGSAGTEQGSVPRHLPSRAVSLVLPFAAASKRRPEKPPARPRRHYASSSAKGRVDVAGHLKRRPGNLKLPSPMRRRSGHLRQVVLSH
ncbi:hypothetical protein AURDEDRAFT_121935 [Auricularia subglabra TFB-10046 SS5]|nr:hypothetical protein AURDEDRAFT_121935 [Auricularia subglabra TFB-10046 SS5]